MEELNVNEENYFNAIIENQNIINEKIDKIATLVYLNQKNINNLIYSNNDLVRSIEFLKNKLADMEIQIQNINNNEDSQEIQDLMAQINEIKEELEQMKFYSNL